MADYDLQYQDTYIDALLATANELKTAGYIYKGVATPSTNPGTPTERVAYLASEPGTYTNFGGIVIASGLYSLTYAGGTWTGTQMQVGSDIEVVQTTGQSTSDVMSQKAVTDEIASVPISYTLTHFNNFIPVSCWGNKRYEGLGLYTRSGYYSWGLIGLTGGTKVLVKTNKSIDRAVSFRTDAYITKQQSAGDTTLRDLTPLEVSSSLFLLEVPSDRTNIGISFNGNPGQVSYCICEDDFNLTDYSDEKIREIENVFDGLLFPLSEKEDIQYTSPSSYIYIDGNTWYWKTGSASATSVFAKVSPSSRYLIQAPNSSSISFFWLKDTSATNNTFPNFAGGGMPRDFWVGAGKSITIDTPEDCEYLCFLIHTSLNRTKPAYIIKRTNDINVIEGVSSIGEKALSISNGVSKAVELAPIESYGLYINTNTNKWVANLETSYSILYHVIGGSKIKVTSSDAYKCSYIFLRSISPSAGDDVDYAGVHGGTNIPVGTTIIINVPSDARYIYFLHHSSLNLREPKLIVGQYVSNGIDAIDFVGDSMTQRNISITSPRGYYPSKVMQYLGIDGYNMGAGGENAATILGRCDGIPYKLASDVTIPAGTTQVQIYLTNIYGQYLLPIIQRYTSHDVVIDGIEGTLTTTQTDPAASNANYFFTRKASGNAYSAKAGDDIFVKDFKATLNPHRAKIIWVGQNGGFDTNSTSRYGGDVTDPTDRARLIEMIKTYIAVSGCEYYMVLSASQKTNNDLETDFAKAFGNRYFNVRMYMVNHGIEDAIALGYLSASGYPTQQDITDMNNGVVPSSLRADNVHFTENGFYTMAYALSIKLKEIWNL